MSQTSFYRRAVRQAVAIGALPFTMVIVVPVWILRETGVSLALPNTLIGWTAVSTGLVLAIVGATLFISCLRRFGNEGDGTLAPWAPPRNLVMTGPYAYVRNPMISGVLLLLLAESATLRSSALLTWAALFALISAIYIPLLEEPQLRQRFGEAYDEYADKVPRLIPRFRRWTGPHTS